MIGQNIYEDAIDLLQDALIVVETSDCVLECSVPSKMGHAYATLCEAQFKSNNIKDALETYDKAFAYLSSKNVETIELFAVLQLRRSDIHLSQHEFDKAHELIAFVVRFFDEQDTLQGQAQYARASYKQGLAFQKEGNQRRSKRAFSSARQALEDFYEEHERSKILPEILTLEDFEEPLEFGYR